MGATTRIAARSSRAAPPDGRKAALTELVHGIARGVIANVAAGGLIASQEMETDNGEY